MKAVFRLIQAYFTGTSGLRWISIAGLVGAIAACVVATYLPQTTGAVLFGFLAPMALILGSSMMPLIVGRFLRSHAICVLPHARVKLFLSVLITVALVSFPPPLLNMLGQRALVSPSVLARFSTPKLWIMAAEQVLSLYPVVFLSTSWLYVAIWCVTSKRTLWGLMQAAIVFIAIFYVPSRAIIAIDSSAPSDWNFYFTWALECAITWLAFAAAVFLPPSLRRSDGLRRVVHSVSQRWPLSGNTSGREVDLLLGTARPWMLSLGLALPLGLQLAVGFQWPRTWLLYLVLIAAVSGAIACRAAERSRAIWLRMRWSRDELFQHIERSFWKHNGFAVVMLAVALVGVVRYYDLPVTLLMLGAPLLFIATLLSTYLGLMVTQGLRGSESILGIAVMLSLMGVAVLAARANPEIHIVIAAEIVLLVAGLILRSCAAHRWSHIDWRLCKPDIGAVAR